jgi:hypothetical protein
MTISLLAVGIPSGKPADASSAIFRWVYLRNDHPQLADLIENSLTRSGDGRTNRLHQATDI